jgi:hypothetical protein
MATILDLFKSQKKDIYGKSENIRIESRGLINPPRGAALLASSPNALADLIGGQIGGLLGGSANRPSDTIFRNDSFLAKPISLFKSPEGLRKAVEKGDVYFVKKSPSPNSIIATIKQGASNPLGVAANIGFGLLKGLKDRNPTRDNPYGAKYTTTFNGKTINETKTFSKFGNPKDTTGFYQEYVKSINPITGQEEYRAGTIKNRDLSTLLKDKSFDIVNRDILEALSAADDYTDKVYEEFKQKNTLNTPFVYIKTYGKTDSGILLPGTISGISEDFSPEISEFKYVGSPFNVYKYGGVSRSLKFDLKLYYYDYKTKVTMKKNLDKLRKLVFPDEDISVNKYNNSAQASPMLFNPNLVYLTINGLYDSLFGIIDTLSISIDESTSWGSFDIGDTSLSSSTKAPEIFPTVVNISMGMKIIENPNVEDNKYVYNFTGHTAQTLKEYLKNVNELVNSK